ncbi:MAG: hypothetical protein HPM95_07125 [Alphaproteobacteria bacterium]|nr:hypothetical protein [Alphaproteobacteria bacterium]
MLAQNVGAAGGIDAHNRIGAGIEAVTLVETAPAITGSLRASGVRVKMDVDEVSQQAADLRRAREHRGGQKALKGGTYLVGRQRFHIPVSVATAMRSRPASCVAISPR